MSKTYWVAFALIGGVGGKTITRLLQHFGSLEAALDASYNDLIRVPNIGTATANAIKQIDLSQIESLCQQWKQSGIHTITWQDGALYPPNLLLCDDAPPVLFARGTPQASDSRAIAIIGTRTPRPESEELAYRLGSELAAHGWTIVSGLALGIDAAAHQGALDVNGRTVAVLGSGLMRVYPPANHELAHRIAASGVLFSELHPEEKVSPQHLIARNRITSGLSRAVIVVQSGEDSGSMSTARRARQQGRTVFAVLGGDSGCDALLADGAIPVESAGLNFDALHDKLSKLPISTPFNELS